MIYQSQENQINIVEKTRVEDDDTLSLESDRSSQGYIN